LNVLEIVKISPEYYREVGRVYIAVYRCNSDSGFVQKDGERGREGGLTNSALPADDGDLSQTNPLLTKRLTLGSVT
jgi:hypothetical protein